jgi:hypothetical protein
MPSEMGNLSRLAYLDFAYLSDIIGSLPSQFVNLSSLSTLRSTDSFDNEIPFSSFLLSLPQNLEHVEIISGGFTGVIPIEIGNFQSLTSLILSQLRITGTLPTEIGLLTELQLLHLNYLVRLVGNVPSEISKLTHLNHLNIRCTLDETPLPSELASLSGLEVTRDCV